MRRRSARTPATSAAKTPTDPSHDNIFKDIFKDNEDHDAAARLWLDNQDSFPRPFRNKQAFLRNNLEAPDASPADLNR